MGSTTFTKYDKNRYRKIYPINRKRPRSGFRSDAEIIIETLSLEFNNEESKSGAFVERYSELPSVVFSASSTSYETDSNVNLYVSSINLEGGIVSFTIDASDTFTGTVSVNTLSVKSR